VARYLTVWDGRYILRNDSLEIEERRTLLAAERFAGKSVPFRDLTLYGQHITIYVCKTGYDGSRRWVAWVDGEAININGRCGANRDNAVRNLLIALAQRVEVAEEIAWESAHA
jgi:hypothetical protein